MAKRQAKHEQKATPRDEALRVMGLASVFAFPPLGPIVWWRARRRLQELEAQGAAGRAKQTADEAVWLGIAGTVVACALAIFLIVLLVIVPLIEGRGV